MPAAKKSKNSDRSVCTRTEKLLLAMLCVVVCTIVFLLVRH
jgi:cell division protein FtsL